MDTRKLAVKMSSLGVKLHQYMGKIKLAECRNALSDTGPLLEIKIKVEREIIQLNRLWVQKVKDYKNSNLGKNRIGGDIILYHI